MASYENLQAKAALSQRKHCYRCKTKAPLGPEGITQDLLLCISSGALLQSSGALRFPFASPQNPFSISIICKIQSTHWNEHDGDSHSTLNHLRYAASLHLFTF